MQIDINRICEAELLEYLQKTPLNREIDIEAYVRKVYSLATIFTIAENHKIIALSIVYFNDKNAQRGYITYIHVCKDYRGNGIGKKLLQVTIEYGKKYGFKKVALEVKKVNEIAKSLYTNFGFTYYEETDKSYYMQYIIH